MNVLSVFIGGGLGSVVRYLIGITLLRSTLTLPLATLLSNVIACLVFAFTLHFIESREPSASYLKALVLTGFCGGLSTFSTFGYESFLLLKQENYLWLILNIVISLVLCIGSFILIKK